jgi:hypothetical protein
MERTVHPKHQQVERWNDADEQDVPSGQEVLPAGVFDDREEVNDRNASHADVLDVVPKQFNIQIVGEQLKHIARRENENKKRYQDEMDLEVLRPFLPEEEGQQGSQDCHGDIEQYRGPNFDHLGSNNSIRILEWLTPGSQG